MSKAQQGGAEGAQAPPYQNIDIHFLSFSPTFVVGCIASRDGMHFRISFGSTTRGCNAFVIKPGYYGFLRFEKY